VRHKHTVCPSGRAASKKPSSKVFYIRDGHDTIQFDTSGVKTCYILYSPQDAHCRDSDSNSKKEVNLKNSRLLAGTAALEFCVAQERLMALGNSVQYR